MIICRQGAPLSEHSPGLSRMAKIQTEPKCGIFKIIVLNDTVWVENAAEMHLRDFYTKSLFNWMWGCDNWLFRSNNFLILSLSNKSNEVFVIWSLSDPVDRITCTITAQSVLRTLVKFHLKTHLFPLTFHPWSTMTLSASTLMPHQ